MGSPTQQRLPVPPTAVTNSTLHVTFDTDQVCPTQQWETARPRTVSHWVLASQLLKDLSAVKKEQYQVLSMCSHELHPPTATREQQVSTPQHPGTDLRLKSHPTQLSKVKQRE